MFVVSPNKTCFGWLYGRDIVEMARLSLAIKSEVFY